MRTISSTPQLRAKRLAASIASLFAVLAPVSALALSGFINPYPGRLGVVEEAVVRGRGPPGALAAEVVKAQRVIEPEEVADAVVEGLRDERFLILPHAEVADYERARATDRGRWLAAMRRLQAKLTGGGA